MYNDPQQPFTQYPPPPPSGPPPRKKRGPLFWAALTVGIIVLLIIGGNAINAATTAPTTQATSTPVTQATAPDVKATSTAVVLATQDAALYATAQASITPTPTPAPPKWTTTHTFSGDGDKKTDVFSVGDTWKIIYQCQGFTDGTNIDGSMYISVYNSDGTIADASAASPDCRANGWTKGDTTEHQAGDIYLGIGATGAWAIQIQEMK